MKFITFLIAALLISLTATQQVKAESYDLKTGLMPAKYSGQWALPSCDAPTSVITIYGHLILDATESTNFSLRVTKTVMSGDIFIAHIANLDFFMTDLTDNSLRIARLYSDDQSHGKSLEEMVAEQTHLYKRCPDLEVSAPWASLHPAAIKAAPELHKLEMTCKGQFIEDSVECQQHTFAFLDEDQDGLLNRSELERTYLLATFFGGSTNCYFPHHFTDIVKSDSTAFAEETISSMDTNKDYKLSLDEIAANWETAKFQRSFTRFMEYTNDLAILLYFIPHYPYIER